MYYTYILRNDFTGRYYVGYTPDLKNRIKTHLLGQVKSTKSNLNYKLEWYCAFRARGEALAFEKYLKSGSGIAFMKKRFFKSSDVVLAKDNISK
jgi:putative endonuclease